MPKRDAWRKANKSNVPSKPTPAVPQPATSGAPSRFPFLWVLIGGALAIGVGMWLWSGSRPGAHRGETDAPPRFFSPRAQDPAAFQQAQRNSPAAKKKGDSFLDAFGEKDSGAEAEPTGPPLANEALEKKFQSLLTLKDRLRALAERAKGWKDKPSAKEFQSALEERDRIQADMDKGFAAFEKDVGQARKARPKDAVPAWLTGELLILVGGEPEEILPHLRRAVEGGLSRPRVLASMARAEVEANQLEQAFLSAAKALDLDGKDDYVWNAFTLTAFNLERFAEVTARLDRAFPAEKPDWAATMRRAAVDWQTRWEAEEKLRAAEQKADNLPRVRLTIEHRRFARDSRGLPTTKSEPTGTGEVILELFEDQAPATVANFISLVSQKTYDGTRFHLAEAATLVTGGDPGSKKGEPLDDGGGGPGYVIPDEFNSPGARGHFRGSLSMVNAGPHTAGSQFFITLVPIHEMDGHFTVFGRVIKGQEVVDRITRGRTNPNVGRYGRIIPGDLLLRAEVLRKRDHEYRVTREKTP